MCRLGILREPSSVSEQSIKLIRGVTSAHSLGTGIGPGLCTCDRRTGLIHWLQTQLCTISPWRVSWETQKEHLWTMNRRVLELSAITSVSGWTDTLLFLFSYQILSQTLLWGQNCWDFTTCCHCIQHLLVKKCNNSRNPVLFSYYFYIC